MGLSTRSPAKQVNTADHLCVLVVTLYLLCQRACPDEGDGVLTRGQHGHEGTAHSQEDGALMRGWRAHKGMARSQGDGALTRGWHAHKGMARSQGDGALTRGWRAHKGMARSQGDGALTRGQVTAHSRGDGPRTDGMVWIRGKTCKLEQVELLTWPCETAPFPNVDLNFCSMLLC